MESLVSRGLWEMCVHVSEQTEEHVFFMHQGIFWADDPPKACQHFSLQEKITHSQKSRSFTCIQMDGLVVPVKYELVLGVFNFPRAGSEAEGKEEPTTAHVDSW
jgi:hypothetical protein